MRFAAELCLCEYHINHYIIPNGVSQCLMPRPAEIVYGKKAMFGNGRESENFSAGDREVRKHLCVVRNKRRE